LSGSDTASRGGRWVRRALGSLRAWKAMADLAEFVRVVRVSGAAVGAQAVHVVLDVVPAPHADLWAVVVCAPSARARERDER
jgi:hypothetical protein